MQENSARKFTIGFLQKDDIYSLDSYFLSEINETDTMNLESVREISDSLLGFVLMKGILFYSLYGKKMELFVNNKVRIQLIKKRTILILKKFFNFENPISVELELFPYEANPIFQKNLEFYFENKNLKFCGGGILEGAITINDFILSMYKKYQLQNKVGKFFIRTNTHSFLYPINSYEKKNFFIAEKKSLPINYLFFSIILE